MEPRKLLGGSLPRTPRGPLTKATISLRTTAYFSTRQALLEPDRDLPLETDREKSPQSDRLAETRRATRLEQKSPWKPRGCSFLGSRVRSHLQASWQ